MPGEILTWEDIERTYKALKAEREKIKAGLPDWVRDAEIAMSEATFSYIAIRWGISHSSFLETFDFAGSKLKIVTQIPFGYVFSTKNGKSMVLQVN